MEPEEQNSIPFDPLQSAAEHLLTRCHQSTVAIARTTLLTDPERRNRIWRWRCQLHATDRLVPKTVIIKQVRPEGYDPSSPQAWDTGRFFNDWAGARFLTECAPDEGHGPAFFGGDVQQGFIILEDMGEHTSLVEPLLQGDATSASEALIAFARRLGRMHACSVGKEAQYREIQRQISPAWAERDVPSADAASQDGY